MKTYNPFVTGFFDQNICSIHFDWGLKKHYQHNLSTPVGKNVNHYLLAKTNIIIPDIRYIHSNKNVGMLLKIVVTSKTTYA